MRDSPEKADWPIIALHFLVGFVLGATGGFLVSGRRRGLGLPADLALLFICGVGLILGGYGAMRGNRLWLRADFRSLPLEAPAHNRTSILLCQFSMLAGTVMVVMALLERFVL